MSLVLSTFSTGVSRKRDLTTACHILHMELVRCPPDDEVDTRWLRLMTANVSKTPDFEGGRAHRAKPKQRSGLPAKVTFWREPEARDRARRGGNLGTSRRLRTAESRRRLAHPRP